MYNYFLLLVTKNILSFSHLLDLEKPETLQEGTPV